MPDEDGNTAGVGTPKDFASQAAANCPRISPVPIGLADASEEIDLLLTNLERGVIHPGDNRQTGDRNTVVVESLVGIHAYDRFTAAFENQLPLVLGKVF